MSRSYHKYHVCKDHNKGQKQIANRHLRRNENKLFPLKGGNYKKFYPQWDICDWCWRWTREEAIEDWYVEEAEHFKGYAWRHERYQTLENWLSYWAKCVKRK